MAMIRSYAQPTVEARPVANVNVPGAPAGAFGNAMQTAGDAQALQQAGQQVQQAAQTTDRMATDEMKIADDTFVQEQAQQYQSERRKLLYTNPDAYYRTRGEAAITAMDPTMAKLNELREAYLGRVNNDRQRRKLGEKLDFFTSEAEEGMSRHVNVQSLVWQDSVAKGKVKNALDEAAVSYNDPGKVNLQLQGAWQTEYDRVYKQTGSAELATAEARRVTSAGYKSVVTLMSASDPAGALKFFEANRDKFDADDLVGIERSLKTMATGQAASAWVLKNSGGPTTEGAKAGTKASMSFWQTPDAKGEKYSPTVAAGITAGFLRESQFFTGAVNPRDGRDGSDSINIGQWNGPRAKAFQEFAKAKGLDPRDVNTGMLYARAEIDGEIPQSVSGVDPSLKTKLANAKSEKEAADLMTRYYFKPLHTDGESAIRQQSATAILKEYGGVQVAGGGGEPAGAMDGGDTATRPAPALASEGVIDARRMMIEVDKRRLELLAKAQAEFANNPPMLQQTTHQIEAQYAIQKSRVQLHKDQVYAGVQDWMTKGGPNGGPAVTLPPPQIFSQLTWEQQQSVERQVERNIAGKKAVTRPDVWYTIHQGLTAGDANVREMWASTPLMQFKEFLSDQDFQELAKLQGSVRKGEGKELTTVQTNSAMVNQTLLTMGIDPTPKPSTDPNSDAVKSAQFNRVFQNELTTLEETTGKKASPQDVQKILDGLVKKVSVEGWLWSGQKPVAFLTVKDVPAVDREQIIAAIRKQGGTPTEERVLEVYRHRMVTQPTQTEIPRPAPAANVSMGVEPIGVGAGGLGAGTAPAAAPGAPDNRTVRERYQDAMAVPSRDLATMSVDAVRRMLGL